MEKPNTLCPYCGSDDVEAISETRASTLWACSCCSRGFSVPKDHRQREEERDARVKESQP